MPTLNSKVEVANDLSQHKTLLLLDMQQIRVQTEAPTDSFNLAGEVTNELSYIEDMLVDVIKTVFLDRPFQ